MLPDRIIKDYPGLKSTIPPEKWNYYVTLEVMPYCIHPLNRSETDPYYNPVTVYYTTSRSDAFLVKHRLEDDGYNGRDVRCVVRETRGMYVSEYHPNDVDFLLDEYTISPKPGMVDRRNKDVMFVRCSYCTIADRVDIPPKEGMLYGRTRKIKTEWPPELKDELMEVNNA